jgi:hypothetical protein
LALALALLPALLLLLLLAVLLLPSGLQRPSASPPPLPPPPRRAKGFGSEQPKQEAARPQPEVIEEDRKWKLVACGFQEWKVRPLQLQLQLPLLRLLLLRRQRRRAWGCRAAGRCLAAPALAPRLPR